MASRAALENVGRVLRQGDRTAVAEHDHVLPDPPGLGCDGAHTLRRLLQRKGGLGADRAAGGQAHVGDHDVGPGLGHGAGLGLVEHVRGRQHVLGTGEADHLHLEPVAHAGLLQIGPDPAVEETHGREVLHAREAQRLQLVEEVVEEAERVGAVHPGQHRRVPHHRQHLARHLDHDVVGVAVGHQSGERAAARHAIAAGIVDHDEVEPARLLALGGEPGPGPAADDRLAARDHGAEALQNGRASDSWHAVVASLRRKLSLWRAGVERVVPGSRARLVDGFDPPYICSAQRRDAVTEPEPKPPMRRAVTVRLDDDPLGYDVSDLEAAGA